MKDLADLQLRLDRAKQSLREIEEQRNRYSDDVIDLIDEVEGGMRAKQAELAHNRAEFQRLLAEQEEFKGMLASLLASVDAGAPDAGDDVLRRIASLGNGAMDSAVDPYDAVELDTGEIRLGMRRLLRTGRARTGSNGGAEPQEPTT